MASRQILLLEDEVVFTHKGGMFYADTGVDGAPLYAFNPARFRSIVDAMERTWGEWDKGQRFYTGVDRPAPVR